MKQTTQKLFLGCPYEWEVLTCAECPNYTGCKKKKARNTINIILEVMLAIAITIGIVVTIWFVTTGYSTSKQHYTTATTTERESVPEKETVPEEESITEMEIIPEKESIPEMEIIPEKEPIPEKETIPEKEPIPEKETIPEEEIFWEEENILEENYSVDDHNEEYRYNLSKENKILIAKLVWAESRGEPFEGKVAVAAVVLNRYYHGNDRDFDRDSIKAVITQKGQFASIKSVSMDDLNKVPECMEAVEAACKGKDPTRKFFREGALYFFAHNKVEGHQKEIREGLKVMVIGNHSFHYNFEKVW